MNGEEIGWMGWASIASAGLASLILLMHLLRPPRAASSAKLWLLFGLGVLPIASAGSANVSGFSATQSRKFCGSCHVMEPHAKDSEDPSSSSLAAIHARNESFGHDNCYTCHKDYGMYGYVFTKIGGMGHVYYYLTEYKDTPLEEAKRSIRIRKPLPNANCTGCHTTTAPRWLAIGDHAATLEDVRSGKTSCASAGCHGFAHPITKSPGEGGGP
ncbi:MAG: NapC/NirT family cytochrome c [Labilithrix sp.]|nr:NapC/NirT family cytochrome c [Labilithrix sp.]